MNRLVKPAIGLAAVMSLTSCVSGKGDIDAIYARLNQHEQQIMTLNSQVGQVENVLPGQAETWSQVQSMRQDVNTLKGQMDTMQAQGSAQAGGDMAQLRARVDRLETAVRQVASELGLNVEALNAPLPDAGTTPPSGQPYTTPPGGGAPVAPGGGVPVQPQGTAPQAVDTATALYNSGTKAFSDRRYKDAVRDFSDFVKAFPNHNLASNSYFWQGESYYQQKDYANAVLAYNQVIEKYPGSGKLQSSMLKQGMALYYAGKKDAAKVRLNELVSKYPKSPEAERAKKFLSNPS